MENKNRDSDRDKMLEDILSKLGAQEKNSGRTGGGRFEGMGNDIS